MILVTGATGTVGSALVRELLARGEEVRAVTRDPRRIEPRPGLTATTEFGRADAVFLLAPAGPGIPSHDLTALRAAIDAGTPRVVKLSAIGTPDDKSTGTPEESVHWHQPGERAVRDSGLAWTILRPTTFATNSLAWADDIRAGRPVANLFGDGRQGVVDPADVAAVAAEALTDDRHHGHTYTLTGPELLSTPDQLTQLGEVLGVVVARAEIPLDEIRPFFPPEYADVAYEGAALVRRGGNAVLTDDVERVLGRRPGTYRAWAEANRSRF
jgi:uncharacterized protein YbjT (DUF2867 family)